MELAGVPSTAALAVTINQPGMSKGTLDRIARDLRAIKTHEAVWLAEATGVTPGFFLDARPISEAADPSGSLVDALSDVLTGIKDQLREQTVVLNEIKALLGKDIKTAGRIEAATDSLGGAAQKLDDQIQLILQAPRSAPPRKPRAARKTAPKHSPQA